MNLRFKEICDLKNGLKKSKDIRFLKEMNSNLYSPEFSPRFKNQPRNQNSYLPML